MQATMTRVDLTKGPKGWTQPFRQGGSTPRTMSLQGPTPVIVASGDDEILPTYGWVAFGPLERIDDVLGTELLVADYWDGYLWHFPADMVQEATGGCGCGNPWTLCHPEA